MNFFRRKSVGRWNGFLCICHLVLLSEGQVLRPFNGRENFMEWICARMSASGVVTEDTLSIEYTVNEKGCVCDVEVAGGDAVMVSKVKQIMEESPRWRPAKTVDKRDNCSYMA